MDGVRELEKNPADDFEPIPTSAEYRDEAKRLSRKRAAEAGTRIARLLETILND